MQDVRPEYVLWEYILRRSLSTYSGVQKGFGDIELFHDVSVIPYFGRTAKASGHRDFNTMYLSLKNSHKTKRSVSRVDDSVVTGAVRDMLSRKNVSLMAFGTMQLNIPGEFGITVTLPRRTTHKRSMVSMFEEYEKGVLFEARANGVRLTSGAPGRNFR
jgi:hypothetical protein